MSFNLMITIEPYPIRWLPLQTLYCFRLREWYYFVDEVSRLNRPARRYLNSLYLYLFSQNLLPNFSPALTYIGSSPIHAFISYDSYGEVISCNSMVLSAHNLRSHITRRTRCFLGVIRSPITSYSEIRQSQITIPIKHQILWLYVSVYNSTPVHNFQCLQQTAYEELGLSFTELSLSSNVISEVTSS